MPDTTDRLTPHQAIDLALPFALAFVLAVLAAFLAHAGLDLTAVVCRVGAMLATLYGLCREPPRGLRP